MKLPTAYFVLLPFRLEDLTCPHRVDKRNPYVIEKTIQLAKIDYENFITDLCVERWFIEENITSACTLTSAMYGSW